MIDMMNPFLWGLLIYTVWHMFFRQEKVPCPLLQNSDKTGEKT